MTNSRKIILEKIKSTLNKNIFEIHEKPDFEKDVFIKTEKSNIQIFEEELTKASGKVGLVGFVRLSLV